METVTSFIVLSFAVFAVLGAAGTVVARRPLRAAMALLLHIAALAGLFLSLHAHLLAALQLLVYAGAIVTLFVFVIMMIGTPQGAPTSLPTLPHSSSALWTALGASAAMLFGALLLFATLGPDHQLSPQPPNITADFGNVKSVAMELFRDSLLPFELTGVLLLTAIVGAIAIAGPRGVRQSAGAAKREAVERRPRGETS